MRSRLWAGVAWLSLVALAAACGQDPEAARQELQKMKVPYNEASLVDRAGKGDTKVVQLFLQAGMNVNAKNAQGTTPLMAAIDGGHAELVKLLLENHADVNVANKGITPFMAASKAGKTEIVKLLEAKGATPRFTVTPEGVIQDSLLKVEWYEGPDQDTNWDQARAWVSSLQVAGGGWRLPNRKELPLLFLRGWGTHNMDPIFKTRGWWGWTGEEFDASQVWVFSFLDGVEIVGERGSLIDGRAFAVRSRR